MLKEELLKKKAELEKEVANLELKIKPLSEDLKMKRETLQHLDRFIELEDGSTTGFRPSPYPQPSSVKKGDWSDICRSRGWKVGVDSAHRVVKKQNPALHASIPHRCTYDDREYP